MRNRGKAISWGVALAAVAALVTAGTVYATGSSQVAAGSSALSSTQMRSVLVSLGQQPESRFVRGPMTLREAKAANAFVAPASMVFAPQSCATFVDDVLNRMSPVPTEGWIQFGSRVHETHNDNFIQVVVNIPGGASRELLDNIRRSAATCSTGTLTLEGKATGNITYSERTAPVLEGAATLGITGKTKFNTVPGSAEAALVQRYEMPPDAQLLVNAEQECVAASTFVAMGDTLVMVMEADLNYANTLATTMYNRVAQAMSS